MLRWALIFFVVSVIALLFGYSGSAGPAARAAELVFFASIVLAIATLVAALVGRGTRAPR